MRALLVAVAMGTAVLLAGCGRDPGPKGETGAQGPAGPQGAQGLQGVPGPQGDLGAAGTVVRSVQSDGSVSCDASEILVSVFCPSGGAADGAKCATNPTIGLCL